MSNEGAVAQAVNVGLTPGPPNPAIYLERTNVPASSVARLLDGDDIILNPGDQLWGQATAVGVHMMAFGSLLLGAPA